MATLTCPYCKQDLDQAGLGEVVTRTVEAGEVLTLYCKECGAPFGFLRLALPKTREE